MTSTNEQQQQQQQQKGPSTKERLASIVEGFNAFDTEMKIGTRQRREKDEFKIAELKAEMERLDSDLTSEIKRRIEMNKSTQMWFEKELSELDKTFHISLEEKNIATINRLDELHQRITLLDEKFEKDKSYILKYIDEKGEELARMLNQFRTEFENDRVLRLEREAVLVKRLTDHEHIVNEIFANQIDRREKLYQQIKAILEENIKLRDKSSERFQAFFEREIHKLHNDVRIESEIREREDDEIVEALNRYTVKLQSSLKIINSTEM